MSTKCKKRRYISRSSALLAAYEAARALGHGMHCYICPTCSERQFMDIWHLTSSYSHESEVKKRNGQTHSKDRYRLAKVKIREMVG